MKIFFFTIHIITILSKKANATRRIGIPRPGDDYVVGALVTAQIAVKLLYKMLNSVPEFNIS
jgi:hypothetical protein